MTCNTQQLVKALRNERKAFGSTDRAEGKAQLREAKRQAEALARLMGTAA